MSTAMIEKLLDAAFRQLQHDTGPSDPEWVFQRKVLGDEFRKILAVEPMLAAQGEDELRRDLAQAHREAEHMVAQVHQMRERAEKAEAKLAAQPVAQTGVPDLAAMREVHKRLIELAAEIAHRDGMPDVDSWRWPKRVPVALYRDARFAEQLADEKCGRWVSRLREIADELSRVAFAAAPTPSKECEHEWVNADNAHAKNVALCLRCKTIASASDVMPSKQSKEG